MSSETVSDSAVAPDTGVLIVHEKEGSTLLSPEDCLPLSQEELDRRKELESTIDKSVWAVGAAMIEIKKKKLYRLTEDGKPQSWEDYCLRRFAKTRQYAARLMRAVGVYETLRETKVSLLPESVAHADAMSGLEPEEMVAVAQEVAESAKNQNRKPTTEDYKIAASDKRTTDPKPKKRGGRKPRTTTSKLTPAKEPEPIGTGKGQQPAKENDTTDTSPKDSKMRDFSIVVEVVSDVAPIRELNAQMGKPLKEKENFKPTTLRGLVTSDQRQEILKQIEYMT